MKNKTIIITGASRGLGFQLAKHWQIDNTVITLSRNGSHDVDDSIHFFLCDFANQNETAATIQKITRQFTKIDLLINNAAIQVTAPLGIMKVETISQMLDVNLKAPIIISKSVFRKMIQAKSGQIINILSIAPKLSLIGDSVYSASKSGLEAFSKVLNREGHPFGVHVNNIGLSAFPTEMLNQLTNSDNSKLLDLIPHKQLASLKEITSAIEFFESNSADIGGQTLYFGGA